MELFLQFGFQMKTHCCDFMEAWDGGTVILSPRDADALRLPKCAVDIRASGGTVLLDPQFYLPDTDHSQLRSHEYWPDDYDSDEFWVGTDPAELLDSVAELNEQLHCDSFILPGLFAPAVEEHWLERQKILIQRADEKYSKRSKLIATVALSADATRTNDQVHELLDASEEWPVQGVYLVCEHPDSAYLVDDETWMANVLDLIAGFRLGGKDVIVGYANQQMLAAGCAGANAIAAGTFKNVRMFTTAKFETPLDDDEILRKAVWYYCPQTYSEYKLPTLDTARSLGFLDRLRAPQACKSHHADIIFAGGQPSTVGFKDRLSFKHYLQCMHVQAADVKAGSFDETVNRYEKSLELAETLLTELHEQRIRGLDRDFRAVIETNRAALQVLKVNRGPMLRRHWAQL